MIYLEPCPFCGEEMEQRNSKYNPSARCITPDCMGGKVPLISLDVPEDIERWNRRGREQALAAHVDRINRFWLLIDRGYGNPLERHTLDEIIESAPTTSLARRDARMKAEALEEAERLYRHEWRDEFTDVVIDIMRKGRGYIYPEGLLEYAAEYRRQAEEDTP